MEDISSSEDYFAAGGPAHDGPPLVTFAESAPYAPIWLRLIAFLADCMFLLAVTCFMTGAALNSGWLRQAIINSAGPGEILRFLAFFINFSAAVYWTLGVHLYGATLGKWLAGVRVARPDGGPVSIPRAFARFLMYYPGLLALGLGFIWALADPRSQALHDKIAGTVVLEIR